MPPRPSVFALACVLGLLIPTLAALARDATPSPRLAPAPHCLDAREVAEVRQPGPRTLSIATTDKRYYLLALQQDCPGLEADAGASLWGRDGWICGGAGEFARGAGRDCSVATVTPQDAAGHARQSRLSDAGATPTLDRVEVHGNRRPGQQGFRGTTSYCFAPRYLRSWSEDPKGVIVEVSPRHSGGNRYYRVELGSHCPGLDSVSQISFASGMDLGIICGNAGDQLIVERETLTPAVAADHPMFSRPGRALSTAARCPIAAVYPRP